MRLYWPSSRLGWSEKQGPSSRGSEEEEEAVTIRFLLQKVVLLELHFVVLLQPGVQTHTSEERPCPKIPGFWDIKCPFPRGLDLPGLGRWWLWRHLGLGILGWPLMWYMWQILWLSPAPVTFQSILFQCRILRIFFLLHCLLLCGLGILATMGLGVSSSAEGLVLGSPGSSPAGAMQPMVLWRHCFTDCESPFGVAETRWYQQKSYKNLLL